MKCILIVLFLCGTLFAVEPAEFRIRVGALEREALVIAPSRETGTSVPLVFGFHGHGGNAHQAARSFRIQDLWPEALVVYMQGLPTPGQLTDPEGNRNGWQQAAGAQDDRDLKFFDAVLAELRVKHKVDEARIYATGHSNGGAFTYLLWAQRPSVFAAVAPSAAAGRFLRSLTPKPAMHIAGEADALVKFAWQQRAMEVVRGVNGCAASGTEWAPGCTVYPSLKNAPFVSFIHSGGHEYPREAPLLIVRFFKEHPPVAAARKTVVSISGDTFHINGEPTYKGREWRGKSLEGLLINSRMVQGIFDDRNPDTVARWAYPDTGKWDAERNTREFLAAMPEWKKHGLLAFTINFQGGSPTGYSNEQPWHNSAFEADGTLRSDYTERLARILDRADELGMVAIVGYFYFGQDERLRDEAAVLRATDEATQWLLDGGWRNVLVEVNNECNVRYDHAILKPERVHELITRVKSAQHDGRRLLVSTSYGGGTVPRENVVWVSDFLLLHCNGVTEPARIAEMVRRTRAVPGYTPKPILVNEDDHFDFEKPKNNFLAALSERASWGFFDFRMKGENFPDGYQSVPVNWGISSERKRGFFRLLAEITGSAK